MKRNYNKKKKEDHLLFTTKIIIFTVLIIISCYSFKNDGFYFLEDIKNYCHYCIDRLYFEIEHKGETYVFISRELKDMDRDLLLKNIY